MLLNPPVSHLFASKEREQAAGFDLADADDVDEEDEQCAEDAMEWFGEGGGGSHPTSHGENKSSPAKVNDSLPRVGRRFIVDGTHGQHLVWP